MRNFEIRIGCLMLVSSEMKEVIRRIGDSLMDEKTSG
jgi:hypothetical protein